LVLESNVISNGGGGGERVKVTAATTDFSGNFRQSEKSHKNCAKFKIVQM